MKLFDRILNARGIDGAKLDDFLYPKYPYEADVFLLPDMRVAVDRIVKALKKQEKIIIYGDYDIDGLTSVALLKEALICFGFKNVDVFIPNRFIEGYGLAVSAIKKIAEDDVGLIITVDCGSQSVKEIDLANELGVDVLVTDHHLTSDILPKALAVINPKRPDSKYPFKELAGVGVAFKLVQALQMELTGLNFDQSKWLLDLVALGTICDVVPLIEENRVFSYWGLKVLSKTRRPGLLALMKVSGAENDKLNTRSIGFGLGPRINASGRLENAKYSLDLLMSDNDKQAKEKAEFLDLFNKKRRKEQEDIIKEAVEKVEQYKNDSVLVLSSANWNHGIVGIVASKLMERYKKPVFVMQEMGELSKGSARSFGDFNLKKALDYCSDSFIKGGGHSVAAGVSLLTEHIDLFRKKINDYYNSLNLIDQELLLIPKEDAVADFSEINIELVNQINLMEPFGNGNQCPVLRTDNLTVVSIKKMGTNAQHIKLELIDKNNKSMQFVTFNAPKELFVEIGRIISAWYQLEINEWQGRSSVEGKLLYIQ